MCFFKQEETLKKEGIAHKKPNVLFALYFNLPASDIKLRSSALPNVYVCSGPDLDLDFDFAVNQVRNEIVFFFLNLNFK